GSHAFSLLRRWTQEGRAAVRLFGASQILIGATALAATVLMRDLPSLANRIRALWAGQDGGEFGGRLAGSFGAGLAFMFVPAFFMGLAFPLAGAVWATRRGTVGTSVGRLLTANTVGAILGTAVSGFFLVYLFGIERSLHLLVLVNLGMGVAVVATLSSRRWPVALAAAATLLACGARVAFPDWGRVWNQRFFATYVNNTRSLDTPEVALQKRADVEVLYFHEGVNETVSVVRSGGGGQSLIVNGRPEASTELIDVQLQRALGHIPMLLHPNPKRVFVLGTGTGMSLGATALHPEVERVVLGEIEEGVLGVARAFGRWNGNVLDNPRLKVVLNDGRNHLATTREQFDVITADPIHPWSGGAGYLYTVEYFGIVAERLAPGGICSQWLPLYELTAHDVRTVVRSFAQSFKHTQLWLTYYDAVLVGSNEPLVLDEAALGKRLSVPSIRADLAPVQMGTAEDLLSFFLMGTEGAKAFGAPGALNTDDNLVLEFSAPQSQGVVRLDALNVRALWSAREPLLRHLAAAPTEAQRGEQVARWSRHAESAGRFGEAHVRYLLGERSSPALEGVLGELRGRDPDYAPLRFLLAEKALWERSAPSLVGAVDFPVTTAGGERGVLRLSAVRQYVGRTRVLVSVVDNARREIYGQRFVDGEFEALDQEVAKFSGEALGTLQAVAGGLATAERPAPGQGELAQALRAAAVRVVGRLPE
ncbi:MAG: Spermine synthase, partial [Myxococcaceae bacterium]|nr:Spermine synthase [Myxococcaceae bacterium]